MVAIAFLINWLGYQQLYYGYCLLKGYDITWTSLANPVHPYQWPKDGKPPLIQPGNLLPGTVGSNANAAAAASTGNNSQQQNGSNNGSGVLAV